MRSARCGARVRTSRDEIDHGSPHQLAIAIECRLDGITVERCGHDPGTVSLTGTASSARQGVPEVDAGVRAPQVDADVHAHRRAILDDALVSSELDTNR